MLPRIITHLYHQSHSIRRYFFLRAQCALFGRGISFAGEFPVDCGYALLSYISEGMLLLISEGSSPLASIGLFLKVFMNLSKISWSFFLNYSKLNYISFFCEFSLKLRPYCLTATLCRRRTSCFWVLRLDSDLRMRLVKPGRD